MASAWPRLPRARPPEIVGQKRGVLHGYDAWRSLGVIRASGGEGKRRAGRR